MHVLVLGGTGAIGLLLIRDLLDHSHTIVIYARSPQKLPDDITSNSNVTVVKGDLADTSAIAGALKGVHAVVSALGPYANHPSGNPLAHGYSAFIKCMHEQGIPRLIVLGTASIADPLDKKDAVWWAAVQAVKIGAHKAYTDIIAVGETIRNEGKDLAWTIARVPVLTNGQSREYQAGYLGDGKRNTTLPRIGFATFVVDELERNEWVKKSPFLSTT